MNNEPDSWTLVAEISPQFDLAIIRRALDDKDITYRINALEHASELWIASEDQVPLVLQILKELNRQQHAREAHYPANLPFTEQLKKMPVVATLILLSFLGTAVVEWAFTAIHWFTFQDLSFVEKSVLFDTADNAMAKGEYWRLVTPIFLHFGIFHLAFNSVWMWEFGRRIEPLTGSLHLLAVVLLTAIASNMGQYLWSGPSLFGGMSGVVYGLLGYIWIRHKIAPKPILAIPAGLLGFLLFWLFLGMSGLIDLFMSGSIANAAHAVGLVTGMILGGWAGWGESRR